MTSFYRNIISALVAGTVLTSCGAAEEAAPFAPTERVQGRTYEGYQEAIYDLSDSRGTFGANKVWSKGAYVAKLPEGKQTVIQVGFDLSNGADTPLTLVADQVRLESVQTRERVLTDLRPMAPSAPTTIAPNSTGRVEMVFPLPPGYRPDDVLAFRVAWTIDSNGQRFSEFTPFARSAPSLFYVPVDAYYYPYYPYSVRFYDPFWSPDMHVVIVKHHYPRRVIVHGHHHRR